MHKTVSSLWELPIIKLLTIKDKNQGQSSISKTKKHPLH